MKKMFKIEIKENQECFSAQWLCVGQIHFTHIRTCLRSGLTEIVDDTEWTHKYVRNMIYR